MQPRIKEWEFLWLKYSRVGHVECLKLFGHTIYRRCGSICELFGFEWVQK
jgi:hypothetical protein